MRSERCDERVLPARSVAVRDPVSGALISIDPADVTQADLDALPINDDVREQVHDEIGLSSPGEFLAALVELVGEVEAGIAWFR